MLTSDELFSRKSPRRNMRDGFNNADVIALMMLARAVAKEGAIFVEIGSWWGHSSSILGEVARECNGHVYCIDHWKGSEGVPQHLVLADGCFNKFRQNIRELRLSKYVHPLVMNSEVAVKVFADKVADLVFIDGDHRYTGVYHDISKWWPKVKTGGFLCGHDCEMFYEDVEDKASLDNCLDKDFDPDSKCHAGVVKALHECFGPKYTMFQTVSLVHPRKKVLPDGEFTTIWYKQNRRKT